MFLIIGTSTLDLIVTAPERMPALDGDEFTTESLVFCDEPPQMLLGGNGANSAYVLASLGASTALCSAVGDDPPGEMLTRWLDDAGVNTAPLVHHPKKATSSSTIIIDSALNRRTFHHHGASGAFSEHNLPDEILETTDILLITGYPLLSQWRPDGAASILKRAKAIGARTALDIGPAVGRSVQIDELRPFLADVDYLICNGHELTVCTHCEDTTVGISQAIAAGTQHVILKRGHRGAVFKRQDDREPTIVDGFPVDARLTVGAGDSFNAGLLFALQQNWELKSAVRFANALAALVVSSGRGVLGCPQLHNVTELLEESVVRG